MIKENTNNSDEYIIIELSDTIDLHCFHPKDIKTILDEFLDNALTKRYKKVEIIHGKGKSVNKLIVHNYLKQDSRINNFFDKPGNWGTTVVILKNGE